MTQKTLRCKTHAERARRPRLTLCEALLRQADEKRDGGSFRTSANYAATAQRLARDKADCVLASLTRAHVLAWRETMSRAGLGDNTISFYLRTAKAAYNRAMCTDADGHGGAHPFSRISTANARTRKRALNAAQLRRLVDYVPQTPTEAEARDAFMLSFYLRGMPPVDLFALRVSDVQGEYVHYRRSKTGTPLQVHLSEPARRIVRRLTTGDHRGSRALFTRCRATLHGLLRHIGERIGFPQPLTFYVARHTWATMARDTDVPLRIISAALGHSSIMMTQIYLGEIDTGEIDTYNDRLCRRVASCSTASRSKSLK